MMKLGNVISIFSKTQDMRFNSVSSMLHESINRLKSGVYGENPAAMLLIWDRDSQSFKTMYESAELNASQAVALLEVVKHNLITSKMEGK